MIPQCTTSGSLGHHCKLGGHAGFEQPFPEKLKGMNWKTYQQMCDEIDYLEQTSMMSMMQRLGMEL